MTPLFPAGAEQFISFIAGILILAAQGILIRDVYKEKMQPRLLSWLGCNFQIRRSDWVFLSLGLLCLVIYLVSKDPWITTVFAILADFVAGIPTIQSGYAKPLTQKSTAWFFGFFSWSVSLLLCFGHEILFALFPVYLFLYNGTMVYLTMIRRNAAWQQDS